MRLQDVLVAGNLKRLGMVWCDFRVFISVRRGLCWQRFGWSGFEATEGSYKIVVDCVAFSDRLSFAH